MKIKNAQINAFGNLENKQIDLSENINIIKGNNESGKSTFLKFIVDMFYGISKNKRGKEFSDYDRYKPWNSEEFSGKITYILDDGKKYEVFRDFNKKNPKIYNEAGEDISKEFTIDKTNGNKFFVEQTKIEEDTFLSTFASYQNEVQLEKQEQNVLVQKLANLAGTGEDNVSYKKALEKLNKKQIEEIGTLRTTGRPMNVVKENQFKLQDEIGELEEYKQEKYNIEERKNNLNKKIQENQQELEELKKVNKIYEEQVLEKQKLELNQNLVKSYEEKIKSLEEQSDAIEAKNEGMLSFIKESKKREIKEVLGIKSPESETNFFIKLFIRDFVSNIIKDERLKLKDNLTAGKLFEDFASSELKSNKEFCKSVLKIDGRYMPFMESNIRNSKEFMKKAIENDTSSEIDSFTKSDTKLKSDPSLATLYFQKRKENNGYRFI